MVLMTYNVGLLPRVEIQNILWVKVLPLLLIIFLKAFFSVLQLKSSYLGTEFWTDVL